MTERVQPPRDPERELRNMAQRVRALETAKRARDAGRNVSEIRKSLKLARGAFESGDYDSAVRLADEILRELEAALLAK